MASALSQCEANLGPITSWREGLGASCSEVPGRGAGVGGGGPQRLGVSTESHLGFDFSYLPQASGAHRLMVVVPTLGLHGCAWAWLCQSRKEKP